MAPNIPGYKNSVKQLRSEVSKITRAQEKQVLKLYENSINNLTKELNGIKRSTLERQYKKDLLASIKREKHKLVNKLEGKVVEGVSQAAAASTRNDKQLLDIMLHKGGVDLLKGGAFSQVHQNVINDILKGNLYKDGKTLSNRVWSTGKGFEKDIQYIISEGILEKKSANELAKDLQVYLKPPESRGTEFQGSYPHLKNRPIDYRAKRLARTAINHSYQTATIQASQRNPFVEGILWESAMQHGRTCQECMDRDGKVYPVNNVPIDHPNGLCTMSAYISRSLDDIGDEIGKWVRGEEDNPMLDKWFEEYKKENNITDLVKEQVVSKPDTPKIDENVSQGTIDMVGKDALKEYDIPNKPNKYASDHPKWGTEPGEYTVYRAGNLERQLVFTGNNFETVAPYAKTDPGGFLGDDRIGVKSYTVNIKKPYVAKDMPETYNALFGKYPDLDDPDAWVKADNRIGKRLKKDGYDAWVMTNPAPPADKEMVLFKTHEFVETGRQIPQTSKDWWEKEIKENTFFANAYKNGKRVMDIDEWFKTDAYRKGKEAGKWA